MAEIDAKSKQATMAHMNRDHSLDLGLYLRFVNGLSAKQLAAEGNPEMVDMDLKAMYIRTSISGTAHVVPLDPPMAAWGERRQRLIDLAMDARKAFGVPLPEHGPPAAGGQGAAANAADAPASSKEPIKFEAPGVIDLLVLFGVVLYFVLCGLVIVGNDATPTDIWTRVLGTVGITENNFIFGGPDGFRLMMRLTGIPILAIHVAETWWMATTRLAPHKMKPLSLQWSLWTGLTFLIGFGSFLKFDRLARRQARVAAAAAKKH
ncbi:hypothetical protein SCUCBS95973_006619 [Sporothrix curviconia]|uniref:DUF2470 domain-containing protein n=1 Tax=Sporothrix curviconia TaxID=1260050 RepID=A0ABP0C8X8_9PEZI